MTYIMQDMLDLDDHYCVYEWGSGGVLHLHCILWNYDSEYLEDYDLQKYGMFHKFSKQKVQKIANFFNFHVSEWHLGKNNDGSWKYIPNDDDSLPHPASISKSELDKLLEMESMHVEDPTISQEIVCILKSTK